MIDSGAGHSSPPPKEGDPGSLNGQLDSPLNRVAGLTLNSSNNLTALLQEHEQKEQPGTSDRMKRSPEKEEGLREEEHASPTKKRNLQVDTGEFHAAQSPIFLRLIHFCWHTCKGFFCRAHARGRVHALVSLVVLQRKGFRASRCNAVIRAC